MLSVLSLAKKRKLACVAVVLASAVTTVAIAARKRRKTRRNRNVQPYITRCSVPHPLRSDMGTHWKQLLSCGTSSNFIAELNFDRFCVLQVLLPRFEAVRPTANFGSPFRRGPKVRGRHPLLESVDIVGLVLKYLKSTARQYELCGTFGLVPSSLSVWIDYGMEVMWRVLRDKTLKSSRVRWPIVTEMDESYNLLLTNRPNGVLLPNVFGVVDGGRMLCADYADADLQNAYYEGYTGNVEVTKIFVFDFSGAIIHAGVNFPGSWHDSKVVLASGLLLDCLSDERTPRGRAILGDSAFVTKARVIHGKIIRARKCTETVDVPQSSLLATVDAILQRVMPSERQSAEWGIRAMKAPFGRLRLPLAADSSKRFRLLSVCVHLYNLRVREVGLNQIRTVYGNEGEDQQPWVARYIAE